MPAKRPTAGIVVIGDEILAGKFAEENGAYLIGELRALGVAVRRVAIIPDVLDEIAETVRDFSARFDHVFTSGGVGPTHDDLTMAGVALAFGVAVVRDPNLEQALRSYYGARLDERNLRMADVPAGAHFVPADHASWPVPAFRNVYILPGVPLILRRKFGAMKERFRTEPFSSARLAVTMDEGALAPHLDAVVAEFREVSVGSYPRFGGPRYFVIVTFEGPQEPVEGARAALLARLPPELIVAEDQSSAKDE